MINRIMRPMINVIEDSNAHEDVIIVISIPSMDKINFALGSRLTIRRKPEVGYCDDYLGKKEYLNVYSNAFVLMFLVAILEITI